MRLTWLKGISGILSSRGKILRVFSDPSERGDLSGTDDFSGVEDFSDMDDFSGMDDFSDVDDFSGMEDFSDDGDFSGMEDFSDDGDFSEENDFSDGIDFSGECVSSAIFDPPVGSIPLICILSLLCYGSFAHHFTLNLSLSLTRAHTHTAMIMRIYTTVILALIISTNTYLSHAADTISPNQTLSADQTIISSGGGFELGFFTPGKSSKHYIGIWYKKTTEKTVIWVANRETPISDKHSAHLKISQGNLVLVNESQIEIWSTGLNTTDSSSSVSAVLLDDGNLVLRQGLGSNSSSPAKNLWESYNNTSRTWMPGARIGYNKITKKKQFLTSWKNSEDPAPGLFTLEPDQDNSQYVIRRNNSEQ